MNSIRRNIEAAVVALFAVGGTSTAIATELPLSDPTRPPNYDSIPVEEVLTPATTLSLQLIRITGEDRRALINGELIREGETFGASTLLRVKPREVQVESNGKVITLSLYGDAVKQPAIRKNVQ